VLTDGRTDGKEDTKFALRFVGIKPNLACICHFFGRQIMRKIVIINTVASNCCSSSFLAWTLWPILIQATNPLDIQLFSSLSITGHLPAQDYIAQKIYAPSKFRTQYCRPHRHYILTAFIFNFLNERTDCVELYVSSAIRLHGVVLS
jgi:hypothetical protein